MQKLKQALSRPLGRQGSAFVSVVALSLVMCIAAVGFLRLSSSLANSEKLALEETKAFYAAEGGLLAATYYARNFTDNNFQHQHSATQTITPQSNGYSLSCTFDSVSVARMKVSCATTNHVAGGNYNVQVFWNAQAGGSPYAFLYGTENPENDPDSWHFPTPADPSDWDGDGSGQTYLGRFHMNEGIKISGANHRCSFKGGLVTTSDSMGSVIDMNYTKNANAADTLVSNAAGYYNNFDKGVKVKNQDGVANADMHKFIRDSIFFDRFLCGVEQANLGSSTVNDLINSVNLINPSDVNNLTANTLTPGGAVTGDSWPAYRPTLEFYPDSALYFYYTSGTYNRQRYMPYNGKLFKSTTDLNVLGVVAGKVTVVTTAGKSICVVADGRNYLRSGSATNNYYEGIVYKDFSLDASFNPTLGTGNNALALASGKNVVFLPSWKDWRTNALTDRNIHSYVQPFVSGGPKDSLYLFVTAALVALDDPQGSALYFDLNSAHNTLAAGQGRNIRYQNYYRVWTYGSIESRTNRSTSWSQPCGYWDAGLGKWIDWTDWQKGSGALNNNMYCSDPRLGKTIYYPGQFMVRNKSGLINCVYSNWGRTVLFN